MKRRFDRKPAFVHDVREQVRWYRLEAGAPEEVVQGFRRAIEATIEDLLRWPGTGRPCRSTIAGLREVNLPRPYGAFLLIHRVGDDRVEGLMLIHAARDRERLVPRRFGGWA